MAIVVFVACLCFSTVTMQAQKEFPSDMQCKDKFLVQSVLVPGGTTKEASQDYVSSHCQAPCRVMVKRRAGLHSRTVGECRWLWKRMLSTRSWPLEESTSPLANESTCTWSFSVDGLPTSLLSRSPPPSWSLYSQQNPSPLITYPVPDSHALRSCTLLYPPSTPLVVIPTSSPASVFRTHPFSGSCSSAKRTAVRSTR